MPETALPPSIGRYRVEALLGQGAMGVVYRGHDPAIDRPVALKLIRADLLGSRDAAEFVARFRREAQAAGRCHHPNIVAVYDYAEHEGNPFIAMEFVEGEALLDCLDRGQRFAVAEALSIIGQVLDGLACAHGLGIIHRDVKPANVILLPDGKVKVADFGVSRLDDSSLTRDGSTIGSPSYMSPEACRGDPVDARGDLFSAGAVLFELLTGDKPFPGKSYTEVIYKVLNQEPAAIVGRVPGATAAIERVVMRALAKDREQRFASATEMAAALRQAASAPAEEATDRTVLFSAAAPPPPVAPAVAPPVAPAQPAAGMPSWDPETIATLERNLVRHIGPIGKVVVNRSAREASDLESLCQRVGASIPDAAERARFLEEIAELRRKAAIERTSTGSTSGARSRLELSEDDFDAIKRALTQHIGPIAKVVLKRELKQAQTLAELCDKLSAHIESEKERAVFRSAANRLLR